MTELARTLWMASCLALFTASGCGRWVFNYDKNATVEIDFAVSIDSVEALKVTLSETAAEYEFEQLVVPYHPGKSFKFMARNTEFAIHGTSGIDPAHLDLFFFRAKRNRPSNEETRSLAKVFSDRLVEIEGVTLVDYYFEDQDLPENREKAARQ